MSILAKINVTIDDCPGHDTARSTATNSQRAGEGADTNYDHTRAEDPVSEAATTRLGKEGEDEHESVHKPMDQPDTGIVMAVRDYNYLSKTSLIPIRRERSNFTDS